MRLPVMLAVSFVLLAGGCELLDEEYGDEYVYTRADDEISTPGWAERSPTAADIRRAYPAEALNQGVEGRVVLLCTIMPSRALQCTVDRDEQPGYGFGEAALSVATLFRVKPAEAGAPTAVGRQVRVPIRFVVG